jgi:hypothetical protein
VLHIIGAFDVVPDEPDLSDHENNWSPPDNFANGTDLEREVFEDHRKHLGRAEDK